MMSCKEQHGVVNVCDDSLGQMTFCMVRHAFDASMGTYRSVHMDSVMTGPYITGLLNTM